MRSNLISPFWLVSASLALSFAWLLPNHSLPWLGFHGDAWAAFNLLLVSAFVLFRTKFDAIWNTLTAVVVGVATIPLLQYAAGMIPIFGVAWINFAYMLGFLLTILVGSAWEREQPRQAGDYIFLAVTIAAVVSVALQLHQLLGFDGIGPWILYSPTSRHAANMAQPNQLASLLLLGLLGCAWGFLRKQVSAGVSVGLAGFILIGVAITGSRTAWLNLTLMTAAFFYWRGLVPTKRFFPVVVGLLLYFVVLVLTLPHLSQLLGGEDMVFRSPVGDPRWIAWKMFAQAALQKPFFGFGWGQLGYAQFLMLDEKIAFGGSFLQSHNLFLDLVLWNGLAIGLGLALAIMWWIVKIIRRIATFPSVLLFLFVAVLGVHAMLEYPLQYAYFLLPLGLVVGAQSGNFDMPIGLFQRYLAAVVFLLSTVVLTITIIDYLKVEASFYGLRFELKGFRNATPRTPPDVMVLTQWSDHIRFARLVATSGMDVNEIEKMRATVTVSPSAFLMYKLATVLALNQQPLEARLWLRRICQVSPQEHCDAIKAEWATQSLLHAEYAVVPWPEF